MTNLDSRDITLPTSVHVVKTVWMWEADHTFSFFFFRPYFWTAVLEKTLEHPLDFKETKWVNPNRNQSWIFIGRTDAEAKAPILWPPDVKSQLIWKDPDTGEERRQEERGMTGDEMVAWHHQLNGHEFEQALGDGFPFNLCQLILAHKILCSEILRYCSLSAAHYS